MPGRLMAGLRALDPSILGPNPSPAANAYAFLRN